MEFSHTHSITPSFSAFATGGQADLGEELTEALTTLNESKKEKSPAWMKTYMTALINPFSLAMKGLKIFDGEIRQSAGFSVRATGEIICSTLTYTNIVIFPGLTNVICWCTEPDGSDNMPLPDPAAPAAPAASTALVNINGAVFKHHLSTPNDRSSVRVARLVGAGARFFLSNSSDDDDGYWEGARITTQQLDQDFFVKNDNKGQLGIGVLKALAEDYDIANNTTYQPGLLRDINQFVFKLNSTDNDHKFSPVSGLNTSQDLGLNNMRALGDVDKFDMIFLKIRGSRNASIPSVLRFDTIANQELVYDESSPLARMMDENNKIEHMDNFLEYSRVSSPGYRISQ